MDQELSANLCHSGKILLWKYSAHLAMEGCTSLKSFRAFRGIYDFFRHSLPLGGIFGSLDLLAPSVQPSVASYAEQLHGLMEAGKPQRRAQLVPVIHEELVVLSNMLPMSKQQVCPSYGSRGLVGAGLGLVSGMCNGEWKKTKQGNGCIHVTVAPRCCQYGCFLFHLDNALFPQV